MALGGVLEIRGGNNDGVQFRLFVKLLVVAVSRDFLAEVFREIRIRLLASAAPNVGTADDLAVELICHRLVSGQQRAGQAVGKSDDPDADPLIGAGDAGLGAGGLESLRREQPEGTERAGAEDFTTVHRWMVFSELGYRR